MDARSEVADGDTITIRSFEQQDAAAVAQVWNESEEGWNQELFIPYTAEYVLKDALHNDLAILSYIIIDQGMEACSGYRCLERSALPA